MKKILVVVDMQNDFVDGALGTPEAVAIVDNVVDKIKSYAADPDSLIYVTYDTHTEDYMDTAEGKKLPVPHCIQYTEGWKLNSKVQAALAGVHFTLVIKHTFGAYDLPEIIGDDVYLAEDFTVEFIGLCTDICVVSNVMLMKAYWHEVPITVDASCCAGVTTDTHNAALTTMKMCQINVIGE